jgi:hypothetical protein
MLSILIAVATPVLPSCDKQGELALQTSLAADLHVTYAVTGTPLRVCVDQAMYPYAAGRGHRFYACYAVGLGSATDRFCGGGNSYADWHGYRITGPVAHATVHRTVRRLARSRADAAEDAVTTRPRRRSRAASSRRPCSETPSRSPASS